MALTDENNMVMPVAPMMNGGGWGNCLGGESWWILLLFILLGNGGWGGFGGFGGMGGFAADGAALYPWMNQSNQINDGFRDQMMNGNVTSIRDGIMGISTQLCDGFGGVNLGMANGFAGVNQAVSSGLAGTNQNVSNGFANVQQSLCNGFAGVNQGVASGFSQAEIAANGRQMANMNQAFGMQTAMGQGFNQLGGQIADYNGENRLGLAELKYTVATENSADRTQSMQNTRDIIDSQTRGTQAILDKLCAIELDTVKTQLAQAQRENVALQNAVNMASFRESQATQNALFTQGLNNEVDALYNRLKNCPVNTVPVYGNQPVFTCGNQGCGCN